MMSFVCSDVDMHTNKNGKIVFGRSVVAVREGGKLTKLMPASGGDSYVENKKHDERKCWRSSGGFWC